MKGKGMVGRGSNFTSGVVALLLACTGTLSAQMAPSHSSAARDAAATITVADMQTHMGVIAHDSMRGRDTPSPELMKTARYVADRFEEFGLKPGNGESYLQLYPISSIVPAGPEDHGLVLKGPVGETELVYGEQFFTLHDARLSEGEGPLMVADIAEDFGDVDGRIVTVLLTAENIRPVLRGGLAEKLGPHDPAGVLVVLDIPQNFFDQLKRFLSSTQTRVGEVDDTSFPAAFVALSSLPADLAAAVSAGEPAEGWSAEVRSEADVNVEEAPNTIGWLEGSDPELKNEYVVLTAHMDHVGVGRPVDGDSIYNGADTPADRRYIQQMELLNERPQDLIVREVIVVTDTDPSAGTDIRKRLRPRGFALVLIDKDGIVKLRKPSPWHTREIGRAIDKTPVRRQEIRDRTGGVL